MTVLTDDHDRDGPLICSLFLCSGEDFYPTSNTLIHGTHVPTKEGIDRMVEDVEKQ